MKPLILLFIIVQCALNLSAAEYHVSASDGDDANSGIKSAPLRTIQKAAELAIAGDKIIVHEGIYREWVKPRRGGKSDSLRIEYKAAIGEHVEIKGSERVKDWQKMEGGFWKVEIPNSFFCDYNPYKDNIRGDWYAPYGTGLFNHTGEVYINDAAMFEVESLEIMRKGEVLKTALDSEASKYQWYCESDDSKTTIYANFHGFDPNLELVEINVRPACFYPEKNGINFITVSGFTMKHGATQWSAPSAEQIGIIGTNWSKGWIIENNIVKHSKCAGITLGKDRGSGHNVWSQDISRDGSLVYLEVIFSALNNSDWSKEKIGGHVVRNNTISNCEQAGICGSLNAAFSEIIDNRIYDIYIKRQYMGWEVAGIKFHAAIDTTIKGNIIYNAGLGLWLDWMSQGTRVSGNLFFNNETSDMLMEVNHGPYVVDNNIFLSHVSIRDWSQGGAYAHNYFGGLMIVNVDRTRLTPFHIPHSTKIAGLEKIYGGDNRFYNNIFAGYSPEGEGALGMGVYDALDFPSFFGGNVYINNSVPAAADSDSSFLADVIPNISIELNDGCVYLDVSFCGFPMSRQVENGESLGFAKISKALYRNADDSTIVFDVDYFGKPRSSTPQAGPIEGANGEKLRVKVSPK